MWKFRLRSVRVSVCTSFESLEGRRLCATTTLRIATYNLDADTNGNVTAGPGVDTVLEGIGAYAINGTARPIDVLALQETTSNAATVKPIVDALNAYYGAGTYADSPLQLGESNNSPTTGNGPSALVYNTRTVSLLQSYAVPGMLGASTGVYRQIGRYELKPVQSTAAGAFYVYVDHYKSGTGMTNADKRAMEAAVVRQDEATLPADARVVYAGDFNTSTDNEGIFTTLMASGQGQAFDPREPSGGVGQVDESLASLSQSSRALHYRDDYEMVTGNVLNDASGLHILAGTEQAFGNNGSVAYGGSVDSASNTALAGLPNRAAVLTALTTASDHLPVVADYTDVIASRGGSVAGTVTGGPSAETIYLDANNNSVRDNGELATTTSTGGKYAFSAVSAGAYVVRQVLTGGYTQTSPTNNFGRHVTVTDGGSVTGQNFTDKAPAATGGTVSGAITGGPATETVYLDADNDGMLDPNELRTTASSGAYRFSNVPAGAYVVRQVLPSGYAQTSPANGYGRHVTVTNGATVGGQNFTDRSTKRPAASLGFAAYAKPLFGMMPMTDDAWVDAIV